METANNVAITTTAIRTKVAFLIDPPRLGASVCWPLMRPAKAQSVIRKFMTCGDYWRSVAKGKRYPSNWVRTRMEIVPVWEQRPVPVWDWQTREYCFLIKELRTL